jgi:hypothetical protein
MASIDRRVALSGLIVAALPRLIDQAAGYRPLDNGKNLCLDLRRRIAETFRRR